MDKKAHDSTHSMLMMPVPEAHDEAETANRPVHEGIICDGCKMDPIVGPRFKYVPVNFYEFF
jgi:hypothetical protein